MQYSKLFSKNQFDLKIKNVFRGRKRKRIKEKYKERNFYDRTAKVAFWLLLFSFACSVFSGYSEHFYLNEFIGDSVNNKLLVSVLVVVLILIIELIKRNTIPNIFQYYFKYGEIDKVATVLVLVFCSISIFSSFKGAHILPSKMITAPALLNVDSINVYYDNQIASIDKNISKQEKTTWKNRITAQANKNIASLNRQKGKLLGQRQAAIDKAEGRNETIKEDHNNSLEMKGYSIGWATLVNECLLLLIIGFLEYRDFTLSVLEEEREGTTGNSTDLQMMINKAIETAMTRQTPITNNGNKRNFTGFKNYEKQPHDNRASVSNDNRTITHDNREGKNPHLRSCIECNQEYAYKHVKQKFCSDSCRTKHHKNKRKK